MRSRETVTDRDDFICWLPAQDGRDSCLCTLARLGGHISPEGGPAHNDFFEGTKPFLVEPLEGTVRRRRQLVQLRCQLAQLVLELLSFAGL